MRHKASRIAVGALMIVGIAACGGDAADDTPTQSPPPETEPVTEPAEPTAFTADETASEPASTETSFPTPAATEDSPYAYFSTAAIGEPLDLPTADDVAIVMTAPPDTGSGIIPIVIYNGSDGPISNIEVSGRALNGSGETVGQGSSQGFDPTYVPAGEHTFGYVYIDADEMPADASLNDPAIDYDEGVGDFENAVAVDVSAPEHLEDSFVGDVVNPHDISVSGPISVQVACFDSEGNMTTVLNSYAERDELAPGDSSTFGISFYDEFDCTSGILAASGYN